MEKNNIQFRRFEIKGYSEDAEGFYVEGFAAAFDKPDMEPNKYGQYDVLHRGAFAKTIIENKGRIKIIMDHELSMAVGKPILLEERTEGLYIKALISASEEGLQQKIREGVYSEFSIGFVPIKIGIRENAMPNGYPIRDLYEVRLWEVSIVTIAKNEFTRFAEAKGIEKFDILSEMFDNVINKEENEEKKYSLMMLKSMSLEPIESLKPIEVKSLFGQLKFN